MAQELRRQLEEVQRDKRAALERCEAQAAELESARTRISVLQGEMAALQADAAELHSQVQELQVCRRYSTRCSYSFTVNY